MLLFFEQNLGSERGIRQLLQDLYYILYHKFFLSYSESTFFLRKCINKSKASVFRKACQTSKMKCFTQMVNSFQPLTIQNVPQ